jgi:hypothetical protein
MLVEKCGQEGEADVWSVIEFKEGAIYVDLADDDDLDGFEHLLPIVPKTGTITAPASAGANSKCERCGRKRKKCFCP